MRLGIYVDGPYARIGGPESGVATDPADFPFLTFAGEVGSHFTRRVAFARVSGAAGDERFRLPADVEIVELPDFGDLHQIGRLASSAGGTLRAFWRGLDRVDAVWVFGPHPFGLALALLAKARRKHVVLGVRQDTAAYFRSRGGSGRSPAQLAARVIDRAFRLLARWTPTTAVGAEIAAQYGAPDPRVHDMTVSLMRDDDIVDAPQAHDWTDGQIRLLTVGRVDREKNPLLLVRALAELHRDEPDRFAVTWVGAGPMIAEVEALARDLGVGHLISLPGFVPFGEELVARYRDAHAFVHVALTEGVPAVLMEALAAGLPVVATDVGGVRAALQDGAVGLVIPPDDRDALVAAIRRLASDPEGRRVRGERGLELVRGRTLERQTGDVARYISATARANRR